MRLAAMLIGVLAAAAGLFGGFFLTFFAPPAAAGNRVFGYLWLGGPAVAALGAAAVWVWPRLAAAFFGLSAAAWLGFAASVLAHAGAMQEMMRAIQSRGGINALVTMLAPAAIPLLGAYLAHRTSKRGTTRQASS